MIETNREALHDFLRTRRSPKLRSLSGPPPTDEQLREMLTLAARVPDYGKLVPWRFVVIRGDARDRISDAIGACFAADHPGADHAACDKARKRLSHAPLVIAVVFCPKPHPKVSEWEQMLSAGAVCMNLLHAARAIGYAGLWLTEWYASDQRVLAELGISVLERVAGFIHIGREHTSRDDRARPSLEAIVSEY